MDELDDQQDELHDVEHDVQYDQDEPHDVHHDVDDVQSDEAVVEDSGAECQHSDCYKNLKIFKFWFIMISVDNASPTIILNIDVSCEL